MKHGVEARKPRIILDNIDSLRFELYEEKVAQCRIIIYTNIYKNIRNCKMPVVTLGTAPLTLHSSHYFSYENILNKIHKLQSLKWRRVWGTGLWWTHYLRE